MTGSPRVDLIGQYPHLAPVALSEHAHNRIALQRTDDAWLDQVWQDPRTRVLMLDGGLVVVPDTDAPEVTWSAPADVPPGQRLLLGEHDGAVHFALLVEEVPAGMRGEPLRSLVQGVPDDQAALLLHAVALGEWHRSHRFCPRCGSPLEVSAAGHLLVCSRCGRQQFPRTDPAVIMAVIDEDDRLLLGRQPRWPEGRYSTLAGFVEPGESFEQAVVREVLEEVGIEVGDVAYFGNQPWPFPASLMIGFLARARTTDISVDGAEISDARWFTRDEVRTGAEAGSLLLPGGISISRSLIETWYGGPLPGQW